MLVKIINGNYGYFDGISVKPVSPNDKPIEVSSDEARRLVGLGVAEIVSEGGILPANADDVDTSDGEDGNGIPRYNNFSTKAELQSIANEYGCELSANMSKAEMVKALDDFFADAPDFSEV